MFTFSLYEKVTELFRFNLMSLLDSFQVVNCLSILLKSLFMKMRTVSQFCHNFQALRAITY